MTAPRAARAPGRHECAWRGPGSTAPHRHVLALTRLSGGSARPWGRQRTSARGRSAELQRHFCVVSGVRFPVNFFFPPRPCAGASGVCLDPTPGSPLPPCWREVCAELSHPAAVCWFPMESVGPAGGHDGRPRRLSSDTCVPLWAHGRPLSGPGGFASLPRDQTPSSFAQMSCAFLEEHPVRAGQRG